MTLTRMHQRRKKTNNLIRTMGSNKLYNAPTLMSVIFLVAFIGAASPFVVGTAGDAVSSTSNNNHVVSSSTTSNLFQQQAPLVSSSSSSSPIGMSMSKIDTPTDIATKSSQFQIRNFVKRVTDSVVGKNKKQRNWKDGESAASIPSRLLFGYLTPLLKLASNRTLDVNDSFDVPEHRKMDHSVAKLEATYEKVQTKAKKRIEEQKHSKPNMVKTSQSILLLKALLLTQRRSLLLTGILRLCNVIVQAFPAILVARLLRFVEAGETYPLSKALTSAVALVSVLSLKMVTENQFFHSIVKMSTDTRGSLEGLIFDKSLRLPGGGSGVLSKHASGEEKKALGSGGVLNLMQLDASIIEGAALQLHTIWDGALQIIIYTSLLYKYLGPSVFWGIGVLLTVIPLNSVTLRILDRLARRENEAKDARTKRVTESITNMKLLKVQGWENFFADDIRRHRNDELTRHKTRGAVRACNSALSTAVPAIVLVVTLSAYSKTGRPIVASTIFTAISLFNQLRYPLWFYPMLIDALANGKNALRRISSYLSSEEITPYVQELPPTNGGRIEMKNGNFLWSTSEAAKNGEVASPAAPALCDVNLKVEPGEVVAVVGSVGSGKSALIKGLLGELAPVPRMVVEQDDSYSTHPNGGMEKPMVVRNGEVAYCSQEAWLPKGTIRDAIIFGREFDEARYMAAIRDAGLDKDISGNVFGGGDPESAASNGALTHDTDVGEGGSSLSGGQRARVALARALYGGITAKVFLLDDCLAALDASVGSLVFERVTRRLRASGAATVIVTNDPSLPRRCDRVVLMKSLDATDGSSTSCSTVADVGTYDELISRGYNLLSYSATEADTDDISAEKILVGRHMDHGYANHTQTNHIQVKRTHVDHNIEVKDSNVNHHRHNKEESWHLTEEEKPTVRVVGGYKVSANVTDQSCHADPDSIEVDMHNCADYLADHVVPVSPASGIENVDTTASRKKAITEEVTHVAAMTKDVPSTEKTKTRSTKLESADDKMSVKAVPLSAYTSYFKAVRSPKLIAATLAFFALANGAQFFQQYTIAKWTELGREQAMAAALGSTYLRSLVYAAGVVSVSLWLRSFFIMLVGTRASEFYHNRMLSSVFKAPMSFFDATPSGQVLSRFGKELETIDRALPDSFASIIFCVLQISSSAFALAGAITPGMMIPLVFVGSLYVKTMAKFRPAARDMKRTETKTRSPIFTHFGEALRGTEMIRSIPGAAKTWSMNHRSLSDTNLSVYSTVKGLDRWLSCRLENLGNLMVLMSAIASVLLSRAGRLKSGSAGWGLTQSLAITGLMSWTVRNLTFLESQMMSVMRVKELTDLDSEDGQKTRMPKELARSGEALEALFDEKTQVNVTVTPLNETALLADGWPWTGRVQFKKTSMRYNPSSPLVLRDVSLTVPPGTTLGVVGRTGSGKSSLLLTLFRIVEIEDGGSIQIDGVDIRSVSIQTLREKLAIIPQDPVLFAGTIAYNLDATGQATPDEMWAALKAASPELSQQFASNLGLESPISEGGNNLSLGQRQLICLARALLRKSKILVLDEATSSVDSGTDKQVQETIRTQFVDKGVTVITVAHRLDTVLGYDKIAVLGDGEVLEYGTPTDLLKIPNGELRRLVDADRLNKAKGGERRPNTVVS